MHETAVSEMFDEISFSLNSRKRNFANFRAVELLPLLLVEFFVKFNDGDDGNKIDKRVADVTLVLKKC